MSSIQKAYAEWSTTYDSDPNRTRDLDEIVTRKILGDRRFRSVLELGCGTGKNTAFFASIGDNVLALDFSNEMLSKAKDKEFGKHVGFALAELTHPWPCPDQSVDLVTSNLVLEHIEDLSFIFSEAARCLTLGGRFFISELHPFRQYQGVKAKFERDEVETKVDAFVHHLSDYFNAAELSGLTIEHMNEWWDANDEGKPPRLVSFLFRKSRGTQGAPTLEEMK